MIYYLCLYKSQLLIPHRANCDICIGFSSYETCYVGDLDSAAWFCKAVGFFHNTFCNMEADPVETLLFSYNLKLISPPTEFLKTEQKKNSGFSEMTVNYSFLFFTSL